MKPVAIVSLSAAIAALVSAGTSLWLRQPQTALVTSAPTIRVIEAGRDAPGCEPDEDLLGAYCYSSPPNSISASTVAFRKAADGKMSLSCFTGGSNMRIFCRKP